MQCSYPPNFRDFISNIILELANTKGAQFYKVNKTRNNVVDTIIVVKYLVQTVFSTKTYEIPIVIYINKSFPYEAPEIYLERSQETGVNPKNTDIDPNTFRITTPSLKTWNQFSTIPNVLVEINNSFNKYFPIYKLNKRQDPIINDLSQISGNAQNLAQNFNLNQNTQYQQPSNQRESYYNQGQTGYQQPSYNQPSTNNFNQPSTTNFSQPTTNNYNYQQPNNYSNPITKPINYTGDVTGNRGASIYGNQLYETPEEGIKRILIEEIMNNTEQKIKDEVKRLKQQEDKLKNYKNDFNNQIEKYNKVINNSDNIAIDFQNMLKTCENEINSIKNYLSENSSKEINSKNFENFIQIANQKILRVVAVEATIDDFMIVVKKAFERGSMDFEEATKVIRNISREAMKIKFYRELLTKKL